MPPGCAPDCPRGAVPRALLYGVTDDRSDAVLAPPGSPPFRDRLETKVADWLRPWDGTAPADVVVLGAPCSRSSISHSGAAATPAAMRELFAAVSTYDVERDLDLATALVARDAGDARIHVTDPARSRRAIHDAVATVLARAPEALPVIIGGDHAITAPAVEAYRDVRGGPVGLVQLDAHMDVRNLDDGGRTNGTPIRQLLDGGTVDGRNVAQVGLHAWANARAYREYAREHGVTQITARDVARTPIGTIAHRALDAAGDGTRSIYVTLDVDVLDQAHAPGVAAMNPGGMTSWQLFDLMGLLGADPRVAALDVVEIDATLDPRRATVRTALHAVLHFLAGYAARPERRR